MLEGTLNRNCKNYFKSLGPCCKDIPKHQGSFTTQRGVSDHLICYKGRFIAIELKVGTNKPTDLQSNFGKEIEAAGGIFAVCWFLEEVKEVIRKVDEEIDLPVYDEWEGFRHKEE